MATAIVFLKVERKKLNEIPEKLLEIPEITEVYSVSGRWDLVAMVRTRNIDALAGIITNHLLQTEGIVDSETLFAFRCCSKRDLQAMFSID